MDNFIIFCAKYLIFIIVLITLFAGLKLPKRQRLQFVATLVIAGVIALILAKLSGKLYYHPRPFVVKNIKPLVDHANDNGFPSDHATLAFTLAAGVYFYKRQLSFILFGLAFLVGLGRILAHVHSPIDILGGLIIGAIGGWFGRKATTHYLHKRTANQPRSS